MESLLKPPGSEKKLCICRVSRVDPRGMPDPNHPRDQQPKQPSVCCPDSGSAQCCQHRPWLALRTAAQQQAISWRPDRRMTASRASACSHALRLQPKGETRYAASRLPIDCSKINSFPAMQSCAANVTVHLEKALDPVVTGISTLGPIILWLFRAIRKLCNSLHILQAEFYRNKQAEWRAVVYR
jgi:hypothetical protein